MFSVSFAQENLHYEFVLFQTSNYNLFTWAN